MTSMMSLSGKDHACRERHAQAAADLERDGGQQTIECRLAICRHNY
jgi:hypothetical protein